MALWTTLLSSAMEQSKSSGNQQRTGWDDDDNSYRFNDYRMRVGPVNPDKPEARDAADFFLGGNLGLFREAEEQDQNNMEFNLPEFYEDPQYRRTQDYLEPYGMNVMEGNIPDYYKDIGEGGGQQFEDMLARIRRDTQQGVLESQARMGNRGGRGDEAVSKAIGDVESPLRYADYLRSLEGKKFLMNQGRGITEGVRNSALSFGGQKNEFNLQNAKLAYMMQADEDAAWADMLSSGIGALGNAYAISQMGKENAGSANLGAGTQVYAGGPVQSGDYSYWEGY